FHGMVASGTSSKQLDKETDARFVGYFGAVGGGLLSLGTILAVIGGIKSTAAWKEIYSAFGEGGVDAFVQGGGALMENGLGLPACPQPSWPPWQCYSPPRPWTRECVCCASSSRRSVRP